MKIGRRLRLGLMAGVAAVAAIMPASLVHPRHLFALVFAAIGLGLALALAFAQGAVAQQNPVTAIDIALEPDATMVQHAQAANARLLKSFPKGFVLDETHHPHISILHQFVRTDDLDKVFAAASAVLAKEKPTTWTLKAFKYYYIPAPPIGVAGIVIEPTEDLHRLQDELIKAVKPYTVKT
jgi:2'-5' RNA ligase superfamily